jgi:hypothetical protein
VRKREGRTSRRSVRLRPRTIGVVAVLCAAGVALLPLAGPRDDGSAPGSPSNVAPVAAAVVAGPGDDPGVQKYLKAREKLQIDLVNAAVAVRGLNPKDPRAAVRTCGQLAAVTTALNAFAAAPSTSVDALTRAGLAKFTEAAKACLAGNIPAAISGVNAGLAERANALNTLDDVLDGH